MIVRIGKRKYSLFAFDVESHNDDESIAKNETSIWLYSFINENSKVDDENSYGYNLDQFLDRLEDLSTPKRTRTNRPCKNIAVYIYNMSFEFSFLFPYILKRGFTYKENIKFDDEMKFNTVTTKSASSVWSIILKFHKNSGEILFRDMCKIFPGGLGKVAKSFNLPTQKGEIDYRLNRLHGHIVTQEEKTYCFKDTRILIDILLKMKEENDKEFFKSSSAASYACRKMIKQGFPHTYKPMRAFRKIYPLAGKEENDFLRNSVAGGITYSPCLYQFKDIKQTIAHIDAHSMHPTQLYKRRFPFGKGLYYKGKPPRDHVYICCCHIRMSWSGVKLHEVIKLIGLDMGESELYVWDFEIPTILKCYIDCKIEYIDGYAYHTRFLPWRQFYLDCFNNRIKAKKIHDDYNYMRNKLLINSSYGKLLERGHETLFQNILLPNGIITSVEIPNPKGDFNATYTTLYVGSAVPAYSRVTLLEAALKIGWDKVVYFDTDSIFFIKTPETIKALEQLDMKNELGGWSREPDIRRGQFTAPKRYKIEEEQENGSFELVVHMAGINFNKMNKEKDEAPSYEDLDLIKGKYEIQGIRRCKGGSLIIMKERQLKVQKKYQNIYKNNV